MNPDILKRAVELADGWEIGDEQAMDGLAHCFVRLPLKTFSKSIRFDCLIDEPIYLAALAAQLTEQVDRLYGKPHFIEFDSMNGYATVWNNQPCGCLYECNKTEVGEAEGPNRVENTITCIVESNVLEKNDG